MLKILNIKALIYILTLIATFPAMAHESPCEILNHLAAQINVTSSKITNWNHMPETDLVIEMDNMIKLQNAYEKTKPYCTEQSTRSDDCEIIQSLRVKIGMSIAELKHNNNEEHQDSLRKDLMSLKNSAQMNKCQSRLSMKTSAAFEIEYKNFVVTSEIFNLDESGLPVSWEIISDDGTSTVNNI